MGVPGRITSHPKDLALCNRANTYYRLRDFDKALADYTETLRLEPGNARAYNSRGNIYAERGESTRYFWCSENFSRPQNGLTLIRTN